MSPLARTEIPSSDGFLIITLHSELIPEFSNPTYQFVIVLSRGINATRMEFLKLESALDHYNQIQNMAITMARHGML